MVQMPLALKEHQKTLYVELLDFLFVYEWSCGPFKNVKLSAACTLGARKAS